MLADPDGKTTYAANADAYIAQLGELDRWIEDQVKQIPEKRRLLVTNHESMGYFADRYGFKIDLKAKVWQLSEGEKSRLAGASSL